MIARPRLAIILCAAAVAACSADKHPSQPAQPASAPTQGETIENEPQPAVTGSGAPTEESEESEESPPEAAAPGPDASKWDFTLPGVDGTEVSLADYRGKTVVLEWFNPECPFIKYAHGDGPLAERQGPKANPEVVWLSINSNAPGKQGNGRDLNASARQAFGMDWPVLLDESGAVGRRYGATTTPHIFIIDGTGELVYEGALDNAPLGKIDGKKRVDYVDSALQALAAGKAPDPARTKPYGCSVKYGP